MEQVRCTNCGSTAVIPDGSGEFCKCEACGSTFNVPRAVAFSKVTLDRTQDVRAWREYLAKQLRLQQDSNKARDYGGVKLFAQKILSVLPDDFCAMFYVALADRFSDNDVAFNDFLRNASFSGVTPDELKEVTTTLVAAVEPKYLDITKQFIARAYPSTCRGFDAILDRNIKSYIQKLRYASVTDRDVFICHRTAEPDQDIADAICTRLEERGLRCWIAPRNILAGSQNYERDILKGVENSRLFLLVSSFKSIYSEDCEKELKAAVLEGKALYSFRIDDTPYDGAFEKALSSVQWLDAQDDPYSHLEQLVVDVRGILARDEREKAELEEKRLSAREKERLIAEERRVREQERLDRLERIVSGEIAATAAPAYAVRSRLKRAEIEILAQNYDKASAIIDEALDCDPECAVAWWLLMLCDYRMPDDAALLNSGIDFSSHRYYKTAERYAHNDPTFERRITVAGETLRTRAVKMVTADLDEADKLFKAENYAAMSAVLARCDGVFAADDGIIYRKFPDIASRYYWLKLWAKYGQNWLVCVEDVTRETEYQKALKYASPAQVAEYRKARDTVAKNAEMFLRERIKNRSNDGKLCDYLVDNKNILPVDVYNYYSSLLYFRKMLAGLNMTESQLRASTVDISTNEYFMLAQSLATDAQKRDYDILVDLLESNRQKKISADKRAEVMRTQQALIKKTMGYARTVACVVTAALSYIFFASALFMLIDYDDSGQVICAMLLTASIVRIANDGINLSYKNAKIQTLTAVNLTAGILTILLVSGVMFFPQVHAEHALGVTTQVFTIIAIILEGINLNRFKNINRR